MEGKSLKSTQYKLLFGGQRADMAERIETTAPEWPL